TEPAVRVLPRLSSRTSPQRPHQPQHENKPPAPARRCPTHRPSSSPGRSIRLQTADSKTTQAAARTPSPPTSPAATHHRERRMQQEDQRPTIKPPITNTRIRASASASLSARDRPANPHSTHTGPAPSRRYPPPPRTPPEPPESQRGPRQPRLPITDLL